MTRRLVLLAGLLALALAVGEAQTPPPLVPPENLTTWAPGVRGIPTRTTICATVQAATYGNGALEASAGLQAAINACPNGQVVQLSPGLFTLNSYVLIKKPITLRGAGPGVTTLQKTTTEQQQLVIIGASRWPKTDDSTAVALVVNAVKGDRAVTVASAAGFAVGDFVKLDEDDFASATWQPLPKQMNGAARTVLLSDRLSWPMWDGSLTDCDAYCRSWHSRQDRPLSEIKEVAAVAGTTVTFTTPIHITYYTAKAAQLVRYTGGDHRQITYAGIEDLTLTGGHEGNVSFSSAAYSWAKNIECKNYALPCVDITQSFRLELRDSYIHDTIWPYPGGAGYAISLQQGTSEVLIENNIVLGANKVLVMRSSGAGSVVAYNYMDDGLIGYDLGWQEVGLNAAHMLGGHHVLFEGNQSFNYDSDDRWGGTIYQTVFRNHLTGRRRSYEDTSFIRAAGVAYGGWWHAFLGNVLGEAGAMAGWVYQDPGDGTYGDATSVWGTHTKAIWRLGSTTTWGQYADPKAVATTLRDGNFDYLTNTVKWDREAQPLPASLYLTEKPAFFGALDWPWVDPLGAVKTRTLPARQRYDAMQANPTLMAPPNLRVTP